MPRLPLLVGLAGLLAAGLACTSEVDAPVATTVTPEDVERYRTGVVLPLQEVDRDIAALEATAEQADSAAAVAYGRTLDALRQERQQIQADLGALSGRSPEAFAEATAALDARIAALAARVERAPIELAQDPEQLRRAAQAQLVALDAAVQEDPALQRAQGELQQRRQEIEGVLARLGNPEAAFAEVRAEVARRFSVLSERLDEIRSGSPTAPPADAALPPADTTLAPGPAPE